MKILMTCLSCLLCYCLAAQEQFRHYRTMDYQQSLIASKNANAANNRLEWRMQNELRYEGQRDVTIPVVFHILYKDDTQRLSMEKVLAQLEILNEDFAGEAIESFEFDSRIGDQRQLDRYQQNPSNTRIQFCLAQTTERASEKGAVQYIKTAIGEWDDFNAMKQSNGGAIPWNSENYLNIWVCDLPDDNAGYAQMPAGPKASDGIVIDYTYLLNIDEPNQSYNGGHTLTHLVGNYLGLYPLWGPSPCTDDYVNDTPIHNAPNQHCHSIHHLSTCAGNPTEMTNNFMDNTQDACLSLFTKGQMLRMQKMLSPKGPRGSLTTTPTICSQEELLSEIPSQNKLGQPSTTVNFSVQPNPAKERLSIYYSHASSTTEMYQVNIYNIQGQLIFHNERRSDLQHLELDVSNWTPGMYLLNIRQGEHTQTKKLVIE
ncbi:MAG: zinc-dependent metalloprotease [Bacteroidota bacterium]